MKWPEILEGARRLRRPICVGVSVVPRLAAHYDENENPPIPTMRYENTKTLTKNKKKTRGFGHAQEHRP